MQKGRVGAVRGGVAESGGGGSAARAKSHFNLELARIKTKAPDQEAPSQRRTSPLRSRTRHVRPLTRLPTALGIHAKRESASPSLI